MSTTGDDKFKKNPNAPKESKKSTREKAQAAREAAESEQRRRDRNIRVIGGIAILAAVALIVGLGYWGSQKNNSNNNNAGSIVADAKIPATALGADNANAWGVPFKTTASKPVVAVWEDFQCPICANFEATMGPTLTKLADDGKSTLVRRPTTFLDQGQAEQTGPNPNSSARAAAMWGCVLDAGAAQGEKYHQLVFANQPATEGDGWSDAQLLGFAKSAGVTGDALTTVQKCYTDKVYPQWVTNSYLTFTKDAIPGTPTAFVNGTEIPAETLTDATKLAAFIQSHS